MKVLHVISGLSVGGAEMMLLKLLAHSPPSIEASVVSLTDIGPVGESMRAHCQSVRALGMRRGVPDPRAVIRLARWMRSERPDVVQTWMYHADLMGGLAARFGGCPPVAWGVRQAHLDPARARLSTRLAARACALTSRRLPDRIVCVSESARRFHAALGYPEPRMTVIPNGFDLELFRPDPAARVGVRAELGIPSAALVVGLIGRFDPHKDHETFALAAGRVAATLPETRFLLCGLEVTPANRILTGWLERAGVLGRCHLLGRREDIPRITAALDVACSSSTGEGFANVIGEAMASGLPVAATDVGDAAIAIGELGRVVPPADPTALGDAIRQLLEMPCEERQALGQRARARIRAHFEIGAIARLYHDLHTELAAVRRQGAREQAHVR